MTTIYDAENGYAITSGLQSQDVCDEAIDTAMSIAAERGESVILEDEGKLWLVEEDGEVSRISYRDAGFGEGD